LVLGTRWDDSVSDGPDKSGIILNMMNNKVKIRITIAGNGDI
jgi:hypothetical protein